MARPVWFDRGTEVQAIAKHLQDIADTAAPGSLRFAPVAIPAGTPMAALHQAALARARKQLALSHGEADRILAQEVRAVDDLVRTANLLVERLREWYALHAPEATRLIADPEQLARLVSEKGERAAVLTAIDQASLAESSLGTDLAAADLAVLQGFAAALTAVHQSWHALETRIATLMQEVAPNLDSVVGPVIGARLIALSGGLSRLATWPTGTVQLLGAETALFRHIKEGTRPPKHGILFQHPSVHLAPPWQRGAIARSLALAASLASKADAFTKNDLRPMLATQVKTALERIAKERAKPPGPRRERLMTTRAGRPAVPGRPFTSTGPGGRGPPRDGGGWSRGPPRDGPRDGGFNRGPPRDGPREGGFNRGPPRDGPREGGFNRGPPREGGFNRAPPREAGFTRGPMGDAPRDAPRDGGFNRGPPRDGPRDGGFNRGPPRDGPREGGYNRGPSRDGDGRPPPPWKRKPQGAFRSPNKPAAPPGRGPSSRKEDDA